MFSREFFMGAAIAASVLATPLSAEVILLSVTGDVPGGVRAFTDEDLMALPQVSFDTGTIWTESTDSYSGPTLASVLEAAGAGDGALTLSAVNDYKVEVQRDLIGDEAPIIATRINGEPFSVREKGPLWVVFPYDAGPEYQSEVVYAVSVWQLVTIEVK